MRRNPRNWCDRECSKEYGWDSNPEKNPGEDWVIFGRGTGLYEAIRETDGLSFS